MTIEIIIGALIVVAVVAYFLLADNKDTKGAPNKVEPVPAPVVEAKAEQPKPVAKPKKQTKKPATKKASKVDVDSMTKKDLLAHAKKNGIKANASMNKAALLKVIKNAK